MSKSNLDEIKKILRSLLISAKDGLSSQQLERDFVSQIGTPIPYESYGHPTRESLLCNMPDVVLVSKRRGILHYRGVATDETNHIARMVQLQTGECVSYLIYLSSCDKGRMTWFVGIY